MSSTVIVDTGTGMRLMLMVMLVLSGAIAWCEGRLELWLVKEILKFEKRYHRSETGIAMVAAGSATTASRSRVTSVASKAIVVSDGNRLQRMVKVGWMLIRMGLTKVLRRHV